MLADMVRMQCFALSAAVAIIWLYLLVGACTRNNSRYGGRGGGASNDGSRK